MHFFMVVISRFPLWLSSFLSIQLFVLLNRWNGKFLWNMRARMGGGGGGREGEGCFYSEVASFAETWYRRNHVWVWFFLYSIVLRTFNLESVKCHKIPVMSAVYLFKQEIILQQVLYCGNLWFVYTMKQVIVHKFYSGNNPTLESFSWGRGLQW